MEIFKSLFRIGSRQEGSLEIDPITFDELLLSKCQLNFAFKLYKVLDKFGCNPALSPFSLGITLAMMYSGAKGQTAKELNDLLEFHDFHEMNDVNKAYKKIIKSMEKSNRRNFTLSMTNGLLVSGPIFSTFSRIVRQSYHSRIASVDFVRQKEKLASHINRWFANKSKGNIRNMVASENFNQSTKMILINALEFKAKWAKPFDSNDTFKSEFKLDSTTSATVSMMTDRGLYQMTESNYLKCTMLALDYLGDEVTMYIILPKEINGLSILENNLTADDFISLKNSLIEEDIQVLLPKFGSDQVQLPIIESLKRLGVSDAVSDSADFSYIVSKRSDGICLSDINHRVFLNIDENGTVVTGENKSTPTFFSLVKTVKIDHPFLYIIFHKVMNMVLFIGRVTLPNTDNVVF
ncbi:hypothetical protein CHUAL_013672 [Chamberlinius hualienensis]